MIEDTENLIIGAGLAGLAIARELGRLKRPFQLVEARPQIGGRILSQSAGLGEKRAAFDLGPAWFWPGQERIQHLLEDLGLATFEQYSHGLSAVEDIRGQIFLGQDYASMRGSLRLRGGLHALVRGVARDIPDHMVFLDHRVEAIKALDAQMQVHIRQSGTAEETIIRSQRVILAVPPRLAAARIDIDEAVPRAQRELMASIPTWMAGQAKIIALYERPFWREAGLSGDAMSRRGPLTEIHDASPPEGGPFALFGFVGIPAQARADTLALQAACLLQLGRILGPQAAQPIDFLIKDWAQDPWTAAPSDQTLISYHPDYGLPEALSSLCDGRLILASSETAVQFGGYLEGALEAAERCIGEIMK